MVSKNWNIRNVYKVSQHYKNVASIYASLRHARAFIRKTWHWGKLLQKSWGTLIEHGDHETRVYLNNIKVKICIFSWSKSLELNTIEPKEFSNVV